MGMYTQLHLGADLKEDTPEVVINVIKEMLGEGADVEVKPDHPLFHTSRWQYMLRCDGYFTYKTQHIFSKDSNSGYNLNVTCSLKNYDDEITKFLDWINPYLEHYDGDFLGYTRYEEHNEPTLIYYKRR